jgi:hypothetical protein
MPDALYLLIDQLSFFVKSFEKIKEYVGDEKKDWNELNFLI